MDTTNEVPLEAEPLVLVVRGGKSLANQNNTGSAFIKVGVIALGTATLTEIPHWSYGGCTLQVRGKTKPPTPV